MSTNADAITEPEPSRKRSDDEVAQLLLNREWTFDLRRRSRRKSVLHRQEAERTALVWHLSSICLTIMRPLTQSVGADEIAILQTIAVALDPQPAVPSTPSRRPRHGSVQETDRLHRSPCFAGFASLKVEVDVLEGAICGGHTRRPSPEQLVHASAGGVAPIDADYLPSLFRLS